MRTHLCCGHASVVAQLLGEGRLHCGPKGQARAESGLVGWGEHLRGKGAVGSAMQGHQVAAKRGRGKRRGRGKGAEGEKARNGKRRGRRKGAEGEKGRKGEEEATRREGY
eukprot:364859-Chlamydomonas_euryale.AAC.1